MDPYMYPPGGGGGDGLNAYGNPMPSKTSWTTWAFGGIVCIVLIVILVMVWRGKGSDSSGPVGSLADMIVPARDSGTASKATSAPQALDLLVSEAPINTLEPDAQLASFAFESLIKPGYVPDGSAKIVPKPAGNPPYKLVQCGSNGYAIRWKGLYLTVSDPYQLSWSTDKEEPRSCFTIVPGYCGGADAKTKYVMLRSKYNKHFVRPDLQTGLLMCKDTPTARTANSYCWRLEPAIAGVQSCGCTYSYDLQRVVCTPCSVTTTSAPGASCSTVTPGYQAQCCASKQPGSDAYCATILWREVVGRPLREAMLVLRTKRPDLTLRPCPEPCAATGYPTPARNVIVVPYDPRSSIVTAPARVLV